MIDAIQSFLSQYADRIPFLVAGTGNMKVQLSSQRIIEAVIIGAVLAGIGYLAVIPQMKAQLESIEKNVARIESAVGRHTMGGHPFTVQEKINGLESRVNRLEEAE